MLTPDPESVISATLLFAKPAVLPGKVGLGLPDFRDPQVVEPQVGWQVGLLVAGESGPCPYDVPPLGESGAPPAIILWDRVELRQVEGDQLNGA